MVARISRNALTDESLSRATKMLTAQLSMLGAMEHRYRDDADMVYEMKRDDDALCDVLGILLAEQRLRRIEDEEMKLP